MAHVAFILLGIILPILQKGGLAIIDEIDNDLHPHLLPHLIDLFKFEHTNPHQAQLILVVIHLKLNILEASNLFVQKENQESEAWRLDEVVGVRADDNLYAKYMAGAFDAVPNV
jgi:AAA15 family ATPase/GTPase